MRAGLSSSALPRNVLKSANNDSTSVWNGSKSLAVPYRPYASKASDKRGVRVYTHIIPTHLCRPVCLSPLISWELIEGDRGIMLCGSGRNSLHTIAYHVISVCMSRTLSPSLGVRLPSLSWPEELFCSTSEVSRGKRKLVRNSPFDMQLDTLTKHSLCIYMPLSPRLYISYHSNMH